MCTCHTYGAPYCGCYCFNFYKPSPQTSQISDLYHSGRLKIVKKKENPNPGLIGLPQVTAISVQPSCLPLYLCIPAAFCLSSTLPSECESKAQLSSIGITCAMLTNYHPDQHHININCHDARQRRTKNLPRNNSLAKARHILQGKRACRQYKSRKRQDVANRQPHQHHGLPSAK